MPAAWIAIAGAAVNAFGAVQGAKGAKESAKAQQQAAKNIIKDTQAFKSESFGLIGDARSNSEAYLGDVQYIQPFKPVPFTRSTPPDDPRFIEGGTKLSRLSFDVQTGQQRENLAFALGDSANPLRDAQLDFANLASGNTSGFQNELEASAFGALATSAGGPAGMFSNISAKNLFGFKTEGLRNAMAISDFFAEQGTVDPVDPLPSIFALAEFEQEEDAEKQALDIFNRTIDFETARHNSSLSLDVARTGIGLEEFLLNAGISVGQTALDYTSNARLIGAQAAGAGSAANGQALSAIGGSLGQIGGAFTDLNTGKSNSSASSAYSSFLGSSSGFFI